MLGAGERNYSRFMSAACDNNDLMVFVNLLEFIEVDYRVEVD